MASFAAPERASAEACPASFAGAGRANIVRAWVAAEMEQGSGSSSFSWQVEKCPPRRVALSASEDDGTVGGFRPFGLPWNAAVGGSSGTAAAAAAVPLELVVRAALLAPRSVHEADDATLPGGDGWGGFTRALAALSAAQVDDLFACLYERVQQHELRAGEFARLLDALGAARRADVMFGPIIRAINRRSCPASRERRGFDAIEHEAYCQQCHAVAEDDVVRCGGCGVVAYCRARGKDGGKDGVASHAAADEARHSAWCTELLFSRVLRATIPFNEYRNTSRRVVDSTGEGLHFVVTPPAAAAAAAAAGMEETEGTEGTEGTEVKDNVAGEGGKGGEDVRPPVLPDGWRSFFARRAAVLPEASSGGGGDGGGDGGGVAGTGTHFDSLVATDALSSMMTLAWALNNLPGVLPPSKDDVCVHLLGADHERGQPWEEVLAWLPPSIKTLTMVMIGPHCSNFAPTVTLLGVDKDPKEEQNKEQNTGRGGGGGGGGGGVEATVRFVRKQGICACLHEMSKADRAALPKPDLVVAFNAGMIFYPSWQVRHFNPPVCDVCVCVVCVSCVCSVCV